MKKIFGLTESEFVERSLWIIKFTCGRMNGSYAELSAMADRNPEDVRDFDLCAMQPDEQVAKVCDLMHSKPWMTIPEFFEKFGE